MTTAVAISDFPTANLAEELSAILGSEHVLLDSADLAFFSSDIFQEGITAELVIAPGTVEELSAAVRLCTSSGRTVIARGGGWSYTGGYLAVRPQSVVVDLRRLNRIVEINTEDMYVTVECGANWKQLLDALREKGFRTPYFGPISGFASTVGGALSQGSFFMGSTQYGTTAETTLGLEVVIADGTILKTGSGASIHAPSPFFRTYGPDLTGLFLGDTGALGLKARATLKIIPFPKFSRFASYAIEDQAVVLRLLGQIARTGVAADCYAWDPPMVRRFAAQNIDLARDLNYLAGVVKSGESFIGGLKDAARIAIKGKGFAKESNYLLHVTVDDTNEVIADEKIKMIQAIVALEPAVETEASVPRTLRGTPFSYPNGILGPNGERWVPTHGLCPHSRAPRVMTAMDDYFESNRNLIESNGIRICTILFAVGANALCIEPLFYWPDARLPHHERAIEPDVLAKLPLQPENPAATRAMKTLRAGLTAVFMREGCAHVQIGKTYRYRESREPATYALLRALKAAIDPNGRVNPGNLGLD